MHRDERADHMCDELRPLVQAELSAFEPGLAAWHETAHGRFAVWRQARRA